MLISISNSNINNRIIEFIIYYDHTGLSLSSFLSGQETMCDCDELGLCTLGMPSIKRMMK
jgi:hypothetical protein